LHRFLKKGIYKLKKQFPKPDFNRAGVVSSNNIGLVVQLVRIHACHAWGRGFESRPVRFFHFQKLSCKTGLLSFLTMIYKINIIQSEIDGTYYIGYTSDIDKRLFEHNNGLSRYTAKKKP
jgi:hypothetical protein